jgi:hypothetical protein
MKTKPRKHKPTAIAILRCLNYHGMINPNLKSILESGATYNWRGFGDDKYFTMCKVFGIKPNKAFVARFGMKDRT